MLHFIETPLFTKQIKELTDDDNYRDLQEDLIKNPQQGDLVQGTGGVRKTRWSSSSSTGKSGGMRIIYYYIEESGKFFMLLAYPKSKKVTLSAAEKENLRKFTNAIKQVLHNEQ